MTPATKFDYRPGQMGHHHEDVKDRGFVCDYCGGTAFPNGNTMTNSPRGSRMVYFEYTCGNCRQVYGLVSDQRSG